MPMLFHQNMRVFGGHSAIRNAVYGVCFGGIAAVLPAAVAVAGFTEITGAGIGLQAQMAVLATTLDAGIDNLLVMEVGTTALGTTEYIVVTWNSLQIAVAAAGQVTYDNLSRSWVANGQLAPFANAYIPAPHMAYGALDSRGPAWVAGTIGGVAGIFMFMHNMYNLGDRSGGLSGLRRCAAMVRTALGGAGADRRRLQRRAARHGQRPRRRSLRPRGDGVRRSHQHDRGQSLRLLARHRSAGRRRQRPRLPADAGGQRVRPFGHRARPVNAIRPCSHFHAEVPT
ncbi:MAG: hypothetical protein ACK4K7_10755 [Allosphingosinicella sp.]|uniref:hypothetical protein n=1 Tax=Allosphingosinicella sp. TaxID=2823234 RepID=UPI00395D277A